MFAHIVRGKVTSAGDGARQFDRWKSQSGWSALTGGVTAGGELIAVALFSSPAEVPRGWGQGLDEFSVFGTDDVEEVPDGVAREAGFVQMMLSRVADRATVERVEGSSRRGSVAGGPISSAATASGFPTDGSSPSTTSRRRPRPGPVRRASRRPRWPRSSRSGWTSSRTRSGSICPTRGSPPPDRPRPAGGGLQFGGVGRSPDVELHQLHDGQLHLDHHHFQHEHDDHQRPPARTTGRPGGRAGPGAVDRRGAQQAHRRQRHWRTPARVRGQPGLPPACGRRGPRPGAAEPGRAGPGAQGLRRVPPGAGHQALVAWARSQGRGDLVGPYIASVSYHNSAEAVDLTLVERATGRELDMGTSYETFTPAAHTANATGAAAENRRTSVDAMHAEGFQNYAGEWWHFYYYVAGAVPIDEPIR